MQAVRNLMSHFYFLVILKFGAKVLPTKDPVEVKHQLQPSLLPYYDLYCEHSQAPRVVFRIRDLYELKNLITNISFIPHITSCSTYLS